MFARSFSNTGLSILAVLYKKGNALKRCLVVSYSCQKSK